MPLINHDKAIGFANTVERISKATGVNNFSSSSMLRLIAQGLHEDIANFVDLVREGLSNTFPEMSSGRYLDVEGAQYGVYRNTLRSIVLNSADQAVLLEPKDGAPNFSGFLSNPITLRAGTVLTGPAQVRITVLQSVTIQPNDPMLYLTVKVEPLSQVAGIQVKKGDLFKVPTTSVIGEASAYIQIRFNTSISLAVKEESEDDFRARVIFARDNMSKGTLNAIYSAIPLIPSVYGFSLIANARGQGTIDIGITTKRLEQEQEDPAIESVLDIARQQIDAVCPFGYDVDLFTPTPAYVILKYKTQDTAIQHSVIASVAAQIFSSTYRYSSQNQVNLNELKSRLMAALPDLTSFEITSASILDAGIEEILSSSQTTLVAPSDKYIVLTEGNISVSV